MIELKRDYCEFDHELLKSIEKELGDEMLYFVAFGKQGIPTLFVRKNLDIKHYGECGGGDPGQTKVDEDAIRDDINKSKFRRNVTITALITEKADFIRSHGHQERCLDGLGDPCANHRITKPY